MSFAFRQAKLHLVPLCILSEARPKKKGSLIFFFFFFLCQVDKMEWEPSAPREPWVLPHPRSGAREEQDALYLIFPSWNRSVVEGSAVDCVFRPTSFDTREWLPGSNAWRGRIVAAYLQSFFLGVASGATQSKFSALCSCWGKIVRCKEESAERLGTTNLTNLSLFQ